MNVPVCGRQYRGGELARDFPGKGVSHVGYPGRGGRQVPGHDRVDTVFTSYRLPTHHTFVHTDSTPRSDVRVINGSGGSSRAASIALMIFGIALTILGVCTIPFDPPAGILLSGIGILMTAAGAPLVFS